MTVTVDIQGAEQVYVKLKNFDNAVRISLKKAMDLAMIDLSATIKQKLSGGVLNVRTGTLRRSITQQINEDNSGVTGVAGTNIKYAAIHEYGGQVKTRLGTGKNPPKPGGKAYATMPERSYLRSSLKDKQDQIRQRLANAVGEATHGN
ncbi:MAG: phage virion morphogenesis protein [Pseudomonadota bacterium]